MTSLTSFYSFLKPSSTDQVRDGDDTIRTMVDRIDYMLGEAGDNTITPSAANTKTTKVISFGRTYTTTPKVVVSVGRDNNPAANGAGAISLWVDDVSTTGFTVGVMRTSTTLVDFTWAARPNRTD